MERTGGLSSRTKVNRAFEAYLTHPRLVLDFNKVIARICEEAEVRLTNPEKAMLVRKIASTFSRDGRKIHVDYPRGKATRSR